MNITKLTEATSYDPVYSRFFAELAKHGFKVRGLEAEDPNGAYLAVKPGTFNDEWTFSPFGARSEVISKATAPSLQGLDETEVNEYLPDAAFDMATVASDVAFEANRWPGLFKQEVMKRAKPQCEVELVPFTRKDEVFPVMVSFTNEKCLKTFLAEVKRAKLNKLPLYLIRDPFPGEEPAYPHAKVLKLNYEVLAPLVVEPLNNLHDSYVPIDGSELLRRYRVSIVKGLRKARP